MLKQFLRNHRYELLLAALLLHLFTGIVVRDPFWYSAVVWPINVAILGVAGFGIFAGKSRWKNWVRNLLFIPVILMPLGAHAFRYHPVYFLVLSIMYVVFFVFLFWEVMTFLIKPGYINADIISAAACGSLLLVEIVTFLFQILYYQNPACFKGIDAAHHTTVFNDLVYFSSVTLATIGYGDIVPAAPYARLLTALVGLAGQFYSVVLVGIVISKFVAKSDT